MGNIKRFLKSLPEGVVDVLKRTYYRYLIKIGAFHSPEIEYKFLKKIISSGDNVVDIGANVGHYTLLLSRLVGDSGRVVAFEPIPQTFGILTSNVVFSRLKNTTLINGAVLDKASEATFTIPKGNLYQSHISKDGSISVIAFSLKDMLPYNWRVNFIKIDAEGYDKEIILSLKNFISHKRTIVMAELAKSSEKEIEGKLSNYVLKRFQGSHNLFLVPKEKEAQFNSL